MHFPPSISARRHRAGKAFTLLELVITVALIAVLCALCVIAYSKYIRKASDVVSKKNLKNLGVGLGNYLVSTGNWPQVPETLGTGAGGEEDEYWEWWCHTLEPYGVGDTAWHCPWDEKERKSKMKENGETNLPKYWSSYIPTEFDEGSDTPYRWRQAWLWERTDFSGDGQNCLMPDGSIIKFKEPPSSPPRKK
jgi:prepilin-type N-terminal cleavage/methylation domain-containing protein